MVGDSPVVVDTRGLFCPVPIIRTSDAMRNIVAGALLEVIADDPAIESDLPAWCRSNGHKIVSRSVTESTYRFWVQKKAE